MLRMLVALGYSRTDPQLLAKLYLFDARSTTAKFIFPFQSRNDEMRHTICRLATHHLKRQGSPIVAGAAT
jgi:hypothetical protein